MSTSYIDFKDFSPDVVSNLKMHTDTRPTRKNSKTIKFIYSESFQYEPKCRPILSVVFLSSVLETVVGSIIS